MQTCASADAGRGGALRQKWELDRLADETRSRSILFLEQEAAQGSYANTG